MSTLYGRPTPPSHANKSVSIALQLEIEHAFVILPTTHREPLVLIRRILLLLSIWILTKEAELDKLGFLFLDLYVT